MTHQTTTGWGTCGSMRNRSCNTKVSGRRGNGNGLKCHLGWNRTTGQICTGRGASEFPGCGGAKRSKIRARVRGQQRLWLVRRKRRVCRVRQSFRLLLVTSWWDLQQPSPRSPFWTLLLTERGREGTTLLAAMFLSFPQRLIGEWRMVILVSAHPRQ
jgi:hypothetical protein